MAEWLHSRIYRLSSLWYLLIWFSDFVARGPIRFDYFFLCFCNFVTHVSFAPFCILSSFTEVLGEDYGQPALAESGVQPIQSACSGYLQLGYCH